MSNNTEPVDGDGWQLLTEDSDPNILAVLDSIGVCFPWEEKEGRE